MTKDEAAVILTDMADETVPIDGWEHRLTALRLGAANLRLTAAAGRGEIDEDDDRGLKVAEVQIERRISDDDDAIYVRAVDNQGDDLALVESLGMLRFAEDTVIRLRMGEGDG